MMTNGVVTAITEDWVFAEGDYSGESREYGSVGIVESEYGYHIMYFVGSDEIWAASVEMDVVTEKMDNFLNANREKWPMEVNYKKIVMSTVETETAE